MTEPPARILIIGGGRVGLMAALRLERRLRAEAEVMLADPHTYMTYQPLLIYCPGTERPSYYFRARVSDPFDAVIHIDETRAVEPLERTAGWEGGEIPETYPFAV